jgi:adenine-specific DNA-methyltransferase
MEGGYIGREGGNQPWQRDLCQFFTRDEIARFCLRQVPFPRDILSIRLLEPAAGHGAFILPLIARLVAAARSRPLSYDVLLPVLRAYEVDPVVASSLRQRCIEELETNGVDKPNARRIARHWIRNGDFLDARITAAFTHVVGNPPYIRWDAVPSPLRDIYRERFSSFKERADLYVAFIEKSIRLLKPNGILGFLCPGTWTRNVYGASVREALTSKGRIRAIIDLSAIDSFETPADAYPHFFVFQNGATGPTVIASLQPSDKLKKPKARVTRQLVSSQAPFVLSASDDVATAIADARAKFPKLSAAGCTVRVGSATGCNTAFLLGRKTSTIENSRLLPFVNARSIENGIVRWRGTRIVNVFGNDGELVALSRYPKLRNYLQRNKKALKSRAKASKSKIWWRSIDALQPKWYQAPKLLVVDISAVPVIGLDETGYCAGGGVYQIKTE